CTATTNASGVATLTGVSLTGYAVGTYSGFVLATFAGDGSYQASSNSGDLTVTTATSTTTLSVSPASPSVFGQSVTFTATISPSTATGTVNFKDGASSITGCSAQTIRRSTATCTS